MNYRQRGFSAIELVIAVAVIGMLAIAVLGPFASYVDQSQKEKTSQKVRVLAGAIREAYRRELMTVGDAGGDTVRFSGVDIANGSSATAALLSPLQRYASLSADVLATDGYNMPHRLLVSNELAQDVSGTTLNYRVIVALSAGRNGVVESAFDPTTGAFTLGGDDVAEVVNGYTIVRATFDDASRKLQALATAYQNYFLTRFLADSSRSVAIDFFANADPSGASSASWDGAGAVLSSGGAAVDVDAVNLHNALGISIADVTTLEGQRFQVDNSSDGVNQPNHTDPQRALPPYSARLVAPLPGGAQLAVSVSGIYN